MTSFFLIRFICGIGFLNSVRWPSRRARVRKAFPQEKLVFRKELDFSIPLRSTRNTKGG